MPIYGSAPYIEKSIRSVLESDIAVEIQLVAVTYQIDDAVTKVLTAASKDSRVNIIQASGPGIVNALNDGLKYSRFPFIARLDADDVMKPNRLHTQLSYLQENSNIVCVGSQISFINENDYEIGGSNYPVGIISSLAEFHFKCLLAHPSTMYSRDLAIEIGGYQSLVKKGHTDLGEDFDFWLRMSRLGEIANLPTTLTLYRQHEDQTSINNLRAQEIATIYIAAINLNRVSRKTLQLQELALASTISVVSKVYRATGFISTALVFVNLILFRRYGEMHRRKSLIYLVLSNMKRVFFYIFLRKSNKTY